MRGRFHIIIIITGNQEKMIRKTSLTRHNDKLKRTSSIVILVLIFIVIKQACFLDNGTEIHCCKSRNNDVSLTRKQTENTYAH
jgi:hypothetical protein